jgi:hypothetical protein
MPVQRIQTGESSEGGGKAIRSAGKPKNHITLAAVTRRYAGNGRSALCGDGSMAWDDGSFIMVRACATRIIAQ